MSKSAWLSRTHPARPQRTMTACKQPGLAQTLPVRMSTRNGQEMERLEEYGPWHSASAGCHKMSIRHLCTHFMYVFFFLGKCKRITKDYPTTSFFFFNSSIFIYLKIYVQPLGAVVNLCYFTGEASKTWSSPWTSPFLPHAQNRSRA